MKQRAIPRILALVAAAAACADLRSAPETTPLDGGTGTVSSSSSSGTPGASDASVDPDTGLLPPTPEAGLHPSNPCRPIPASCIDATPASVIEVPTEAALQHALALAQPRDVIQLRGGSYGPFALPKDVSLVGCEGATISGALALGGGVQGVADILVTGSIDINVTGSYNLPRVRYSSSISTVQTNAALLITTLGSSAGTEITVAVDDSSFIGRKRGINVIASDVAGPNGVKLTVRNGVFSRVGTPIEMKRLGTPPLRGTVTSSTFYDFTTAITLTDLTTANLAFDVNASIFAKGTTAINGAAGDSNSNFTWHYSLAWNVPAPLASPAAETPTLTTDIDPAFVDPEKDDLRLGPTSLAVNRIPGVFVLPPKDFQGCPRPIGVGGDPGAFESQP